MCHYTILKLLISNHEMRSLAVTSFQEVGGISIIDIVLIKQEVEHRIKSICQIIQQTAVVQGFSLSSSRIFMQPYLEHIVI